MARTISTSSLQQFNAVTSSEAFLVLLDFDFQGEYDNIYVVNNNKDVFSSGQNYTAYAFAITLLNEDSDRLPTVQLTIDNVDRMFIESIRGLQNSPIIKVQLIPASDPNSPEFVIPNLTLANVAYDQFTITGELTYGSVQGRRFPRDDYNPINVPGLF